MEYFYGEDTYQAREEIRSAAHKAKASVRWLDKEDLEAQSLTERLSQGTAGLFGAELLVVRDPSSFPKKLQEDVTKAIELKTAAECIVWDRETPDKRTGLFKTLKRTGREFPVPELGELRAWLAEEAEGRGVILDEAAAKMLVERLGSDRWRLIGELEKLSLAHETVTPEVVRLEVPEIDEQGEIFAMLDALVAGNKKKALGDMEALLQAGESEFYILSMLAYQFRSLYLIASGKTQGMNDYVVRKNQSLARRKPAQYWLDSLTKIMATDFAIKQGKADQRTGLTMLVLSLV